MHVSSVNTLSSEALRAQTERARRAQLGDPPTQRPEFDPVVPQTLRRDGADAFDGDPSEAEIERLTGNSDVSPYDPDIAARAIRDGTTYNGAVENINRTRVLLGVDEMVEPVRALPWESEAVNARVDELMAEDGLSLDAAVVVAMTDRPPTVGTLASVVRELTAEVRGEAPTEAGWEDAFARRATRSSAEIAAWAETQSAAATATFGAASDEITVSTRDDLIVVSDGTTEQVFDPAEHDRIVIVGGGGDDKITVDEDVLANLTIVGGAGDDTIIGGNGSNIVVGGDGDDNIEGGRSRDLIIGGADDDVVYGAGGEDTVVGGVGRDSLYGGAGDDVVLGGDDEDYLDGGRGNDSLRGGAGADTISGGYGRDVIRGETGADTLIGASGTDLYADAAAGDTVIAENDETVEANGATVRRVDVDEGAGRDAVSIDPAARGRFADRVEDDLQTLRSLTSGQAMLDGLDDAQAAGGHVTQITELVDEENGFATASGPNRFLQADGTPGTGESTVIAYNPSVNLDLNTSGATPPIVVLFHEFAHAYHNATGQTVSGQYAPADPTDPNAGTNIRELQAAGIEIDHDADPTTPEQLPNPTGHPFALTENGLREELGLEERTVY